MDPATRAAVLSRLRSIPIATTLEFDVVTLEAGTCSIRVPRRAKYDGIYESLHGGIVMTAADSAAAFAILTVTSPQERIATTDMNIRFLARCVTDIRVVARVIKAGRTLVPVAVDVFDVDDVHVAVAQVTYMRLPGGPPQRASE